MPSHLNAKPTEPASQIGKVKMWGLPPTAVRRAQLDYFLEAEASN
jgi:hypothetical protein